MARENPSNDALSTDDSRTVCVCCILEINEESSRLCDARCQRNEGTMQLVWARPGSKIAPRCEFWVSALGTVAIWMGQELREYTRVRE